MARFLQLSDLHVAAKGARVSGALDTRAIPREVIDRLVSMRAAHDPVDAVLVTGDISDNGSPDTYARARAELDRLNLSLFVVPGNHDARETMRSAFADLTSMPPVGLIDWTANVGDTRIVGLDTLVEGQGGGRLPDKSLDLLTDTQSTIGSGPAIIMLHHPPIRTGIRLIDAIGLENASALEATLADVKNDVTQLAGHVHGVHHGRLGRHVVATAPAICSAFALDRRRDAPVGFMTGPIDCAVVETGPNGIWSAVSLDPADGPFPL